jgi:uncharacterized lipoprotein YehR (DUF1307 family)
MSTRFLFCLALIAALAGCGGKSDSTSKEEAAKVQVEVARATLQQKADALARQASVPPPSDNKKK